MSDNNLKIDITLRKYENNRKEIIRRKEIFKDRKTKLMLKSILDEYCLVCFIGLHSKIKEKEVLIKIYLKLQEKLK